MSKDKKVIHVDFKKKTWCTTCGLCTGKSTHVSDASFDNDISTVEGKDDIIAKLEEFGLADTVDHEKWRLAIENGGYGHKAQWKVYDASHGELDDDLEAIDVKIIEDDAHIRPTIYGLCASLALFCIAFGLYIYIYIGT